VQHSLAMVVAHLPDNSIAGGTTPTGSAIKIACLVHSGGSEGIATICRSAGEAVQHGQLAALTQFICHPFAGTATLRGDAIKVSLLVHDQTCQGGDCPVFLSICKAVQHGFG